MKVELASSVHSRRVARKGPTTAGFKGSVALATSCIQTGSLFSSSLSHTRTQKAPAVTLKISLRTETLVLCPLIKPSVIHFTSLAEHETLQHNILLAFYKARACLAAVHPGWRVVVVCVCVGGHILLAFRGRHPLCGTGVLSVIDTTSRPPIVRPLIADCTTEKNLFVNKAEVWSSSWKDSEVLFLHARRIAAFISLH